MGGVRTDLGLTDILRLGLGIPHRVTQHEALMRQRRFHPAITWLFLICFGASNTLLAGGMVLCQDGHGGSRIEWGCDRNATGECITSCGGESADEEGSVPHPCQDTPIQDNEQITKAPPRLAGEVTIHAPVMVAVLVFWAEMPEPTRIVWTTSEPDRPPDALRHIRTIVLIV